MFALLALAGDVGCAGGPAVVGQLSALFSDNLKAGILSAIIFPILLIAGIIAVKCLQNSQARQGVTETI